MKFLRGFRIRFTTDSLKAYEVIAEIGEMKEHRTGHCYMELVEKTKIQRPSQGQSQGNHMGQHIQGSETVL